MRAGRPLLKLVDIHQALNWKAMWPLLERLDADAPLQVLDAGSHAGSWCRRIASRRPRWRVTGIDSNEAHVAGAIAHERRHPLGNVQYIASDFVTGIPGTYDVIYSIASVHYEAARGRGATVLRAFGAALNPDGIIVLIVPRRAADQPVWSSLPRPQGWPVFTPRELTVLASDAGLQVREMTGLYGSWCSFGKQISLWGQRSTPQRIVAAALHRTVRALPFDLLTPAESRSYAIRAVLARPS